MNYSNIKTGDTLVWTNSGIEVRVYATTPEVVVFEWANGVQGQLPWSEVWNCLQPAPEPEPEWLEGDVADISVRGCWAADVTTLRAIRTDAGWRTKNGDWADVNVEAATALVVIDPGAVDWRGLQSQVSVLVVGAEPFKRAGDILDVVRRELGIEAS